MSSKSVRDQLVEERLHALSARRAASRRRASDSSAPGPAARKPMAPKPTAAVVAAGTAHVARRAGSAARGGARALDQLVGKQRAMRQADLSAGGLAEQADRLMGELGIDASGNPESEAAVLSLLGSLTQAQERAGALCAEVVSSAQCLQLAMIARRLIAGQLRESFRRLAVHAANVMRIAHGLLLADRCVRRVEHTQLWHRFQRFVAAATWHAHVEVSLGALVRVLGRALLAVAAKAWFQWQLALQTSEMRAQRMRLGARRDARDARAPGGMCVYGRGALLVMVARGGRRGVAAAAAVVAAADPLARARARAPAQASTS